MSNINKITINKIVFNLHKFISWIKLKFNHMQNHAKKKSYMIINDR